jgi:hypothetical protein
MIRAELTGSDRCEAEGHAAVGNAPVLGLCRKLVAAGFDPTLPLEAYRGDTLALTVSSIGWGAGRTIEETWRRGPFLTRWMPPARLRSRPLIAFQEAAATTAAASPEKGG